MGMTSTRTYRVRCDVDDCTRLEVIDSEDAWTVKRQLEPLGWIISIPGNRTGGARTKDARIKCPDHHDKSATTCSCTSYNVRVQRPHGGCRARVHRWQRP